MNWNAEMSDAYGVGLEDGLKGRRRGRPNDCEACYQQGYEYGQNKQFRATRNEAARRTAEMTEYLNERMA